MSSPNIDTFSANLTGMVALVSGSSRGLGSVLAKGLAEAGACVILNGRNADTLAAQSEQFKEQGYTHEVAAFDVTNEAEIRQAMDQLRDKGLSIDILVNNAGINRRGPLEELAESDWNDVLSTNLTAPWLLAKHASTDMIRKGAGKIVNIASLMSFGGREGTGAYTASKGGLALLTKAMSVEWAHRGIQCNAIAPGYFLTEMTRPLTEDPAFDQWVKSRTPTRRWGDPQELVGPLLFLCSSACSYVNGQVLYVDGGWTAKL